MIRQLNGIGSVWFLSVQLQVGVVSWTKLLPSSDTDFRKCNLSSAFHYFVFQSPIFLPTLIHFCWKKFLFWPHECNEWMKNFFPFVFQIASPIHERLTMHLIQKRLSKSLFLSYLVQWSLTASVCYSNF